MATKREIFAKNLRKVVDASYQSQAQLAELCGVSAGSFSDWCCGKTFPRPEKLQLLCDVLRVSEYDLTHDVDSDPAKAILNSEVVKLAQELLENNDARALYSDILRLRSEDLFALKQIIKSLPKQD